MPKSMNYAILEAIQGEMRRDELLTLLYEYQGTAARWRGESVDLEAEFGPPRVQFCPIDEEWIVGGALGMSLIGVRAQVGAHRVHARIRARLTQLTQLFAHVVGRGFQSGWHIGIGHTCVLSL